MKSILKWFAEGLEDFKSPYPKEPPMSLKEWIEGGVAMFMFAALFGGTWALLIMLVD